MLYIIIHSESEHALPYTQSPFIRLSSHVHGLTAIASSVIVSICTKIGLLTRVLLHWGVVFVFLGVVPFCFFFFFFVFFLGSSTATSSQQRVVFELI